MALVVAILLPGCVGGKQIRPRAALGSLMPSQRIWVAGFVSEDTEGVDVNTETVRVLRAELRKLGSQGVIEGSPLMLNSEDVLADTGYWRRMGEDYRASLIITGTMYLRRAAPKVTQRGGRAMSYVVEPGLSLESRIVVIDGATGTTLNSRSLPRQVRYGSGRRGVPTFLYFSMMEEVMPALLQIVTARGRVDR